MSTTVESSKATPPAAPSVSDEVCIPVNEFYVDGELVTSRDLCEDEIHELLGISA